MIRRFAKRLACWTEPLAESPAADAVMTAGIVLVIVLVFWPVLIVDAVRRFWPRR